MKTEKVKSAAEKVPTPTLDKMLANKEKSQSIGEFLEWLTEEKKVMLKVLVPETIEYFDESSFEKQVKATGDELGNEARELRYNNPSKWSWAGGLINFRYGIEDLLAEYFGVDLKQADKEKRAILTALRKENA